MKRDEWRGTDDFIDEWIPKMELEIPRLVGEIARLAAELERARTFLQRLKELRSEDTEPIAKARALGLRLGGPFPMDEHGHLVFGVMP